MRKKRFLAIAAAIAISISCAAPVSVFATEVDEAADAIDDEQEAGEQTTIVAPGAESEDTEDNGGSAGESNSGSAGGSNSGSAGGNSSGSTGSSAGSTKSSDSSLSHLGISPGSLSPAFSAGTHEYTATVDAGVTAISVAAKPNSNKAVIASVSGAKSLGPGSNTVKVVVEAENGATTTYTITVNCGSSSAPAQTTAQEDISGAAASEDGGQVLEGEISTIEDTVEEKEESEVTFDDNGYLIYEGNAYLPSSMMPEGEYVSLDKYNKLYEQSQAQKTKNMRMLIILVVVLVLLLIVILNLALKLRDLRQDMKLGLDGVEDDEEPEKKQMDTSMIPNVKMPEQTKPSKTEKPAKAEKPVRTQKPVKAEKPARAEKPVKAEKPAKTEKPSKPAASKPAKKAEDLEILDLNDL